MNLIDIVLASAGLFTAGLIKGVTGIGFSTCALPFLVLAVGLKPAMAIVTIPALVSNFAVIAGGAGLARVISRFWPFYVAIVPGILAGTSVIAFVDLRLAVQLLAVLTLAYVWLALVRPDLTLPPAMARVLAAPAGLLNGFLTGLTGSQIVPLMPYMMALKLAPEEQVQAVNLAVSLASAFLAAALAGAGIMTAELAIASAAGVLPAVAGVAIGGRLRGQLSMAAFRHVALATLAVLALSLYGRGPAQTGVSCAALPGVPIEAATAGALLRHETIR
ncbi:MAG TPA: sulfite exporter TauE/SafE family protein [Hyphomicrobiaceae bacterium]|nr:sulfite exporter TauE/SafE family protein [Hyphomicrobiaceae bacterium]